ncbi:hypothetical protein FNV43_RR11918 [Rhamnella rubrinervis]|uniref:Kinesin motor domain-containing protein n=1 Tax=Rhamnella rubrinervis TaxID=2594499 RepID=A0A8K0MIB2_9ROSA|nr:hypothetical protein FNV43_RR11918 [Rhamnella rubrinervis]
MAMAGEELVSGSNSKEERIFVSVRLRPLNDKELARNEASDWECINNNTIAFKNSLPDRSVVPSAYSFDRVFGCDCPTEQVYEEGAKDVILSVLSGINSTVFAYGQTSSGKTYTMSGITKLAVSDIYNYIEKHKDTEFVMKFSAMEIYNEAVRDLLSSDTTPLRLLDYPEKGTVVEKLTEEVLRDSNHLHELLSLCEAQRKIGETALNEASSRSHQILRLTIESSAREYGGSEMKRSLAATVNLVDLAGSERSSQALSAGTRLKEGSHINRSLLSLGTVIRKLSKGKNGHIPYRDSKLTRILQNSLGGNARTAIICTLSPAHSHVEQSRNALFFASCAKEVTTNACVNVVVSDKVLVMQLQRELAKLETELRNFTSNSTTRDSAALLKEKELLIQQMDKEIKELTLQRDLAQSQVRTMLKPVEGDQISRVDNPGLESSGDIDHLQPRNTSKHNDRPRLANSYEHQRQLSQNSEDSFLLDGSTPKFGGLDPCQGWEELAQSVDEESEGMYKDHKREALPCVEEKAGNVNMKVLEDEGQKEDKELSQIEVDSTYNDMKQKIRDMQRTIDCLVNLYPAEESPCYSEAYMSSSRSLMLTRSRSCKAIVSGSASSISFRESEQNVGTTPDGLEKDIPGKAQGFSKSNYCANIGSLSRKDSLASASSSSVHTRKNSEFDLQEQDAFGSDFLGREEGFRQRLSNAINDGKLSRKDSLEMETEMEYSGSPNRNIEDTFQEDFSGKGEGLRQKLFKSKYGARLGKLSTKPSGTSIMSAPVERQVSEESSDGDDTVSILNYVPGRNRKAKPRYDGDSDILDKNSTRRKLRGNTKDASSDMVKGGIKPYSNWPFEFEIRRREIIKLWDTCNVPLEHRTYFFLLFKGEPSDAVYLEVEQRRLVFLREQFTNANNKKKDSKTLSLASSLKALNRERESLSKKVHKKFSRKEREALYQEWGIKLKTKQRSLQLARLLWTDVNELTHFKKSAALIAKLIGLEEASQAPKEVFAIGFLPRPINHKPFGWKDTMSTL